MANNYLASIPVKAVADGLQVPIGECLPTLSKKMHDCCWVLGQSGSMRASMIRLTGRLTAKTENRIVGLLKYF